MMPHNVTEARARREWLRWLVLFVLASSPGISCNETRLMYMLGAAEGIEGLTRAELRAALVYLHERELIHLESGDHVVHWLAKLTRSGTDIVEYTVPCAPGIARPSRAWH